MLRENKHFYLPNLHTFQNDNVFHGSLGKLRFRVRTQKGTPEQGEAPGIGALCWYGDYCLAESEVVAESWFPLTEEGYEQVIDWLDDQYQILMAQTPEQES
jgi:hypothetical protein